MSHSNANAVANPANAPSERFFGSVGIGPGMRVLDVGCGDGELSRFVAALTGLDGEIIAIDRSETALAMARSKAVDRSVANIEYRLADLSTALSELGTFDAVVGRRVLMYLPNVKDVLSRLREMTRGGGVLGFQEHARAGLPRGLSDLPVHRLIHNWVWDTIVAEGGDDRLGLRLEGILRECGLAPEQITSEAILLQENDPSFIPQLARLMLPRMAEQGIVDRDAVDPDRLAEQIEHERRAVGGTIVWDMAFLVSARR
ncbi:methyltransferase domain-containing protein [Aurantiacibacter aquimixticola]|uniref:Methyltransferase domain-containing protein n=1 Tax=Aurantiacibacter aquimixticola TaxID=1958945 RepID=A0A419RNG4_9SPHN|nr:methyltransferase domain-containing protein [Aurantiacibacter aquimixticola]RJY06929.1 methyltransferase domain-containing protein [Aurantiacibacter aquimixticola]